MVCHSCQEDKPKEDFRASELRRLDRLDGLSSKGTPRLRAKRCDVLARCRACCSKLDKDKWSKAKQRGGQSYENRKAGRRAYHDANRERHVERMSAHYLANVERYDFWKMKACAKRRGATIFMSFEEWQEIRKCRTCHWCGIALHPSFTHMDHIESIRRGGQHSKDNVVMACANCNMRREWELKTTRTLALRVS